MGQKNNALCSCLSDPVIFADFINGSIHNGEKVVSPGQLSDRETVTCQKERTGHLPTRKPQYVERRRDVLKAVFHDDCYIVIGIEAQDRVDYAMPVRCMEYEVTEYKRQLKELKNNRKEKLSGEEFFSGMAKDEKLNPVTTIVFYHGENPYDGCTDLHDMLDLNKENKTYQRFTYQRLVADYHVNLIQASALDETRFETGMRELVGFLKRQEDKTKLMGYFQENEERIRKMDEETFDTVSILLHLPKKISRLRKSTEGDGTDMCRAIREWAADERNAGMMEGEKRFASLTAALLASERLEDLGRAVSDETFRDSLYQEFAL